MHTFGKRFFSCAPRCGRVPPSAHGFPVSAHSGTYIRDLLLDEDSALLTDRVLLYKLAVENSRQRPPRSIATDGDALSQLLNPALSTLSSRGG